MILMTMIARVADALPLAASIQEDEQVSLKYCFFIGKEFLKILTFHQIFIFTVGQKHRWLSKSGKTSLQNLNGYQSYQMFYRVRTLFIPVSFVFTLRIYENLINHCLCLWFIVISSNKMPAFWLYVIEISIRNWHIHFLKIYRKSSTINTDTKSTQLIGHIHLLSLVSYKLINMNNANQGQFYMEVVLSMGTNL